MYKAMLVDDDYPVLEFLSHALEWEKLGVVLQSSHENGASAYEKALEDMPDILITDIGMPKMDGIELTRRLKELNPKLQVAILSCHSDFTYAQKALKLQVQDYLVKDTFNPEDLFEVVRKLKQTLDEENSRSMEHMQLRHLLDRNKEMAKEQFILKTVEAEGLDEKVWHLEARSYGLDLEKQSYEIFLAAIHDFRRVKSRHLSEATLSFAVNNVLEETIIASSPDSIHFPLGAKEFFLFIPILEPAKMNAFSKGSDFIRKLQRSVKRTLDIELNVLEGEICSSAKDVKNELKSLRDEGNFYMKPGDILKKGHRIEKSESQFSRYDEAAADIREIILLRDHAAIPPFVDKWISYLEEEKFPPEMVKEWVLKLVLDLKVKLQALQYFRSADSAENLHNELLEIDFLSELKIWLLDYFQVVVTLAEEVYDQTKRKEILDAYRYVSVNLEKKISLEEVARHLFLNPSYFSRLFKKEVGETFVEYVTKMKINRAKELLEQTSDPVGKVCERLGYDNQSYFIKLFKNYAGLTPVEYRAGKQ